MARTALQTRHPQLSDAHTRLVRTKLDSMCVKNEQTVEALYAIHVGVTMIIIAIEAHTNIDRTVHHPPGGGYQPVHTESRDVFIPGAVSGVGGV